MRWSLPGMYLRAPRTCGRPLCRRALPSSRTRDDGEFANDTIKGLIEHLLIAILAVFFVVTAFLGVRQALIVGLAIPWYWPLPWAWCGWPAIASTGSR